MKRRLLAGFGSAIFLFAMFFCAGALAQTPTADPGNGPSEHPDAPMEGGVQATQNPQPGAPPEGAPQSAPMGEAQPGGPSGEAPAASNQGVARISMIHGAVSTQRGDSGDWSAAVLNQPVVGGDKVSTGDAGRAELQLDFANILRLGASSKANIANLTKDKIQIQVGQGIANYTVFKESETEPEIDTPNVAVHPSHHDGVFRIEVRPDGDTLVIVRKGEAQIATPKGIAQVRQGEMATVRGTIDDAQYKISAAPIPDDWDRWNSDRDHMIRDAQSWKHTNHYYTGSEDLDANGRWENAPDYGDVWVPNEPEGWAPYRDGNWVWEPYWGWTWVGYEPWGWAPYHYGRWMWYGGAWAWWPGPVWGGFYRPFWAPAYVSFYGWGVGFGFGFGWGGWGGFGWLPIGPGDWFHPWWGGYGGRFGWVGGRGFDRFGGFAPLHAGAGFSNVAHINDPHIGAAMSTVSAGRFGAGRVTAEAATHEQLSGARMMAGNLPVVPSRASLSASGRPAAASTMRSGGAEHFFGTQTASRPPSFHEQTAQLRQSMQQNHVAAVQAGSRTNSGFGSTQRAGAGSSAGGRESGRETNSETARSANSERRTSSEAGNAEAQRSANTTENSSRDGFRSFTPPSHSESSEASGRSGGESGNYWSRTAPSSVGSSGRGYSDGYGRGSGSARPQLNMRQPVVQPRSSGSYGGGSRSAPSYGGGHSSGGGGGHASGGGGHSGGGGGHR